MHISLDGFVAGPQGEMDWILFNAEIGDYVKNATDEADTVLYGRVTYGMMESYWPTAADQPGASKHDIEHAQWVKKAQKIVFSSSLKTTNWENTRIEKDIPATVAHLKEQPGKNLLLIGSPRIAHAMMDLDLIDEYWINVNPIILGAGIPLFRNIRHRTRLELLSSLTFSCGVVGLRYRSV